MIRIIIAKVNQRSSIEFSIATTLLRGGLSDRWKHNSRVVEDVPRYVAADSEVSPGRRWESLRGSF